MRINYKNNPWLRLGVFLFIKYILIKSLTRIVIWLLIVLKVNLNMYKKWGVSILNKYINNLINSAGIVLIFVSLIGAMQSRILWLDKLSNGLIVTITISLILLFLFITFAKKSLFQKVFSFIRLYEKRIFWIFLYFV